VIFSLELACDDYNIYSYGSNYLAYENCIQFCRDKNIKELVIKKYFCAN